MSEIKKSNENLSAFFLETQVCTILACFIRMLQIFIYLIFFRETTILKKCTCNSRQLILLSADFLNIYNLILT